MLPMMFVRVEVMFLAIVVGAAMASDPRCSGYGSFDDEWDECSCHEGFAGETCEACAQGYAGWPSCLLLPESGDQQKLGWDHLCPEVASLRSSLPSFVVKLGHLYVARQTVLRGRILATHDHSDKPFIHSGDLHNCSYGDASGPWRLKVDLKAPDNAPAAYSKHHRIVLLFDENWPMALPTIRFAGRLRTVYGMDSDERESFGQNLHTTEANGLLQQRLQELAGGSVVCMWRQTGECSSKGTPREPDKDLLCSAQVPTGASGFCDCDGDGIKGEWEHGYTCESSPGTCESVCPEGSMIEASSAPPQHKLLTLLQALHESFGAALNSEDARLWKRGAASFAEETSTELKYRRYGRKHPALYGIDGVPQEESIDPALRSLIQEAATEPSREAAKQHLLKSGLITEVIPGLVFSFRVFTEEFCKLLMEEILHFYGSNLPARRPNSMNNYGIILNEIGLETLAFTLQDSVIQPLAAALLPEAGSELESHHSFTIRYRGGEDTHLDVHTDDSDVTFNVNIFENYTGAPLVFCGINGDPDHRHFRTAYQHELGHAVLHLGRHRHGAEDITSGERMNLIVWSYSYNYRSSTASEKKHKKEASPPDTRCVSYTHDRDFAHFRSFPPGKKERHLGRGWCPPRGKEYDGFVPDVKDSDLPRQQGGGQ